VLISRADFVAIRRYTWPHEFFVAALPVALDPVSGAFLHIS